MSLITFFNRIVYIKIIYLFVLSLSCFLIGYGIAKLTKPKKRKNELNLKEYSGLLWQVKKLESGEIEIGDLYCPRCKVELIKGSNPETIFSDIKFKCSNPECNFVFLANQDLLDRTREGIKVLIEAEEREDFKSK